MSLLLLLLSYLGKIIKGAVYGIDNISFYKDSVEARNFKKRRKKYIWKDKKVN
jgi:hypothetical protein